MFFGSTVLMSKNTELDFTVYSVSLDRMRRGDGKAITSHTSRTFLNAAVCTSKTIWCPVGVMLRFILDRIMELYLVIPQVYIPTYVATMHTAAILHRIAFYLCKVQRSLLGLRWTIFWRNVF